MPQDEESEAEESDHEDFALDDLSDDDQLSHIVELEGETISIDSHNLDEDSQNDKPALISNGLPPIPARLLKRVENGLFVEMAELSPSYLDSSDCSIDDQHVGPRKRLPALKDIMDWVGCFGIYIAIVSRQKPKRVPDLLGYQRIIMGASLHCREGKWLTYDRRFRLKASASNATEWSTIDITIWNTTFPERAIYGYHSQGPLHYQSRSNPPQKPARPLLPAQQPICLDWNDNPNGCSRNPCRYAHVCYRCVHNPGA